MNSKTGLFIVAVIGLWLAFWPNNNTSHFEQSEAKKQIQSPAKRLPHLSPSMNAQSQTSNSKQQSLANELEQKQNQHFKKRIQQLHLPSIDEYRNDVKKNHHSTPASLIGAGLDLSNLFDSVSNSRQARELMRTLKTCSHSLENRPNPLKVYCLKYARKLAIKFPNTATEYRLAWQQADDRTRQLYKLLYEK